MTASTGKTFSVQVSNHGLQMMPSTAVGEQ